MRKYRIAHILPWCSIGGAEHATLRIAQAVDHDRFEHVAFCLRDAWPVREMFASAGFSTVEYGVKEPSFRKSVPYVWAMSKLARTLREQRIDLMHCTDLMSGHNTALAGFLAGIPVLCHIRGRFDEISRRDRVFLAPVRKFAFVSRDTWRRFGFHVPEERGAVIYDGLDIPTVDSFETARALRAEFDIGADEKIVGMAARVAPAKDYRTLVRAARRVCAVAPKVRFVIIGDNDTAESYRTHYAEVCRWIADAGLTGRFVFTGARADAVRLMAGLDVFVLSTHQEGLPLVLIEAMAQARPVVATGIDGIPELVADGITGYVCGHENDEELAARILDLLQDDVRAGAFGRAGRELVAARFTREQFGSSLAALYTEMCHGAGKATAI